MSKRKGYTKMWFLVLLLVVFVAGCGHDNGTSGVSGGGGGSPDITAPTVNSTNPANGATNVGINRKVTATFSETMDPLSITGATFIVKQGATVVSGTVTFSGITAVFTPAPVSNLTASTLYTATVTTGAKDLAGNGLAGNFEWTFTTGTTADNTAPTVTGTINANGAINVPINTRVGATFSEAMDPLTITNATFALKETVSGTAVAGAVSYSGVNAVFTPAGNLASNKRYTVTIKSGSGGAKDLAGNALAADFVISWTTGAADTAAPTVIGTIHANGATNVPVNTQVGATFSEGMDPLTITTANFKLRVTATGAAVGGTVSYSGVNAVFTPAGNLANNTGYTVTIKGGSSGAKDLAGNALATDYTWSWTTAAVADSTSPTVTSTVPSDLATGVTTNSKINATFSEAMDPLTITTANFTVKETVSGNNVPGTVSYAGTTAAFTPLIELTAGTGYTATITTGVKDLAGNALAANKVWSFTTGTTPSAGPAPVLLGSAGNYVILAKAAISTTGLTAVTGNIGLSPAAATYITGFTLIADPSNVFSTSTLVTGQIFAADYAVPTPTNLTTAVLDMMIAYTDAAGRAPDVTELGSGNIGGMTLAPGTYKWSSGVQIPSNITLSGGPNDVWIFQIAQDLVMSSSTRINLTGGAKAKNVFWQVFGIVDIGTGAHFEGIALIQTAVTLKTGATVNGRLLAQTAVTLDASTVVQPVP